MMSARDTITRMSSQWPPSPTSRLKGVMGVVAMMAVSVISWLVLESISTQVLQAQNAQAIQTTRVVVAGTVTEMKILGEHDGKTDLTLQALTLTAQRLTDMIARHDADIAEIKDDARDRRRRARRE